ncbi:methyl-accepting chemotaxis protein [Oxalobacteraceae bacterium A2-2]
MGLFSRAAAWGPWRWLVAAYTAARRRGLSPPEAGKALTARIPFAGAPAAGSPAAGSPAAGSPTAGSTPLAARLGAAGSALDGAFAHSLQQMVDQTEQSTLAVMERMRALSERSSGLLASLDQAMAEASSQEQHVARDVALLERVAAFLNDLPRRVQHDMDTLAKFSSEIRSLSGLAEAVQAISMQSHLLSVNAAIEASRAGAQGAAFAVVANEMRMLASNSHAAASQIGGALARARAVLEDGMEVNTTAAAREFSEMAAVAEHVSHLQTRLDQLSSCYRAPLEAVAAHGVALAEGTADVLGAMQFQDILRQHVERLVAANQERGAIAAQLAPRVQEDAETTQLADRLEALLASYTEEEARHGQPGADGDGAPAIELF